jgi:hypothetical protein
MIKQEINAAALEAFPVNMMYGGGQPATDTNNELRVAFIKGFEFRQWLNDVSMTGPEVPLHIKYRMFYNQKKADLEKRWLKSETEEAEQKTNTNDMSLNDESSAP